MLHPKLTNETKERLAIKQHLQIITNSFQTKFFRSRKLVEYKTRRVNLQEVLFFCMVNAMRDLPNLEIFNSKTQVSKKTIRVDTPARRSMPNSLQRIHETQEMPIFTTGRETPMSSNAIFLGPEIHGDL
ncbi:unnamed protein product [Cercopithifilaria johnstoni]|uniref:Uncharacterized protein n=1 Tax=Cercopithifilaria johnstoni TaxID=2874296 RepID=A0A8J2M9S5_9BILA|nr:unnamed protein product [Cercopithifilaria johnstoni]